MKVAFRADASLQIGTGHVMRCLTLARALVARGHECAFLSRLHDGNLAAYVRKEGFEVHEMPALHSTTALSAGGLAHASWLGVSQDADAAQSAVFLREWKPDWLVVDHYALDQTWEDLTRGLRARLFVIDDLADRKHQCDALLDQTLGRLAADYEALVPAGCSMFVGTSYALLRPEFSQLRSYSLERRTSHKLEQILISMGGVDQQNATAAVLEALRASTLEPSCRLEVVLGPTAPWLKQVREVATTMPFATQVLAGVRDMADRMVSCDLAIGAAGSTSWERCCLGVPTLMVVLAENQRPSALALSQQGAAMLVGNPADVPSELPKALAAAMGTGRLGEMASLAASVCDGLGAARIVDYLETLS